MSKQTIINPRIGEQNVNRQGKRMAVAKYYTVNDIDIIWEEDDSIQKTTYSAFRRGAVIKNSEKLAMSDWDGIEVTDQDGLKAILINCRDEFNVTVRYPDGDIISGLTLDEAVNGDFGKEYTETVTDHIVFGQRERKARGIKFERKTPFIYM